MSDHQELIVLSALVDKARRVRPDREAELRRILDGQAPPRVGWRGKRKSEGLDDKGGGG